MINYILAPIIWYMDIGLPFMLYNLKRNASFKQVYFSWYC